MLGFYTYAGIQKHLEESQAEAKASPRDYGAALDYCGAVLCAVDQYKELVGICFDLRALIVNHAAAALKNQKLASDRAALNVSTDTNAPLYSVYGTPETRKNEPIESRAIQIIERALKRMEERLVKLDAAQYSKEQNATTPREIA